MELTGAIQTYAWGKLGRNSKVALLHASSDSLFIIEDGSPYAELWMGTHCNGPSCFKRTGQKLRDYITANEECLGKEVINQFGKELPFLFKVLSVNKTLSVQAHPSKSHAEELHRLHPELYKDPNHKPELAIALTTFEALCGFRPIKEIKGYILAIPQLQSIIGEQLVSSFLENNNPGTERELLKKCFQRLMSCPSEVVAEQLTSLVNDVETDKDSSRLRNLMIALNSQFPGDVGCFCIYFLNHIILNPGESIYLGPNVPHAYLSGDCIECMACSDNVVRAGLTPKFRDVETLCNMLTYECTSADSVKFHPRSEDACTLLFQPEVPDFAVAYIKIPQETTEYKTIPRNSASILLVVEGEGSYSCGVLKPGSILFLPAKKQFKIKSETKLNIFQAFANV